MENGKSVLILALSILCSFLLGAVIVLLVTRPKETFKSADSTKQATAVGVQKYPNQSQVSEQQASIDAQLKALEVQVNSYNSACKRIESAAANSERYGNQVINEPSLFNDPDFKATQDQNSSALLSAVREASTLLQSIQQNSLFSVHFRFGAVLGSANELPVVRNASGGKGLSYIDKL
jgi:hypothetical protein